MMKGMLQDQNLEKQIEKQMGCMAGFLQLFDRHQLLTSKKIHSSKRLPPSKVVDAAQGSEESAASSPAISRELGKPQTDAKPPATPSPEKTKHKLPLPELRSPELLPPKSPLPLPIFELKEGTRLSWKFSKEAPRLSLDSRATADSKGNLHPREIRTKDSVLTTNRGDNAGDGDDKQRRSPSVIARLMGLEPLPDSNLEPVKDIELRRSASESRVSRDLFQYPSADNNNFQLKQPNQSHSAAQNATENTRSFTNSRPLDQSNLYSLKNNGNSSKSLQPTQAYRGMVSSPWKAPPHQKRFFDIADVFPEPKQAAVSIYGYIEKRLKMRGIYEPSKDLETLKQILESLQLKGLLHSKRHSEQRNFIYDRSIFPSHVSSIVVMGPSKSPAVSRRMGNDSPTSRYGVRRNSNFPGDYSPSVSPRRERPVIDRNVRSPTRTRSESNPRRSNNLIVKPKSLNIETQRRAANESMENRRVSPIQSPKLTSRTNKSSSSSLPDQTVTTNRSPRNRRSAAEIYQREKIITTVVTEDESSSISESTFSTYSQIDSERWKMEDYREGKNLLQRCDNLLHSIAEMNATDNMQPSPVSVLDSPSFYKDESSSASSPSPVVKRRQRDCEFDEETWSSIFTLLVESKLENINEDSDFVYISEILMATHYLPEDCDVFLKLEKQQYLKEKDTSEVSRLERRLNFDIIAEILERNSQLPPWKGFSLTDSVTVKSSVRKVWSEFQRIRDRGRERETTADDLFEMVCGVLKKDLAGDAINGWGDCPVELSEAVLDIERLIFKDLMSEAIRDLAAFAGRSTASTAPRRKLTF